MAKKERWVDDTLNAERYIEMLHTRIIPDLNEVTSPEELRKFYIWMQDGSSSHTTPDNITYLASRFSCVISKNAEIAWPPYSPDLNPCDYFLWSEAKQKYLSSPNIQDHIMDFENKMASISLEVCQAAIDDFPRRIQLCLDAHGGHFIEK